MESNDSPEILDRGETSDIPGLPSGVETQTLHKDCVTYRIISNVCVKGLEGGRRLLGYCCFTHAPAMRSSQSSGKEDEEEESVS